MLFIPLSQLENVFTLPSQFACIQHNNALFYRNENSNCIPMAFGVCVTVWLCGCVAVCVSVQVRGYVFANDT